jgi:hypothetical protein
MQRAFGVVEVLLLECSVSTTQDLDDEAFHRQGFEENCKRTMKVRNTALQQF